MPVSPTEFSFPLEEAREGETTLLVPRSAHRHGPKRKEGVPFYNPAMRVARDVSVLLLRRLMRERAGPWQVCDAMAAMGARGLRLAHEVPGVEALLNDANPESVRLARRNAERLGLSGMEFREGRLESLLAERRFDWVDIDPYGSPAGFLDAAVGAVEPGGVLAVTATDMATLSGVYPHACQRRYNARPRRGACMPELAVRILVGAATRAAGRQDQSARPLLSYATQHFCRAYLRIEDGARKADAALANLGHAQFFPDGARSVATGAARGDDWAGPLWAGPLLDSELVESLGSDLAPNQTFARETLRLVNRWSEESQAPPLYYTTDEIVRGQRAPSPRLEKWIDALRGLGYVATRTHFSPIAIKTDAPPAAIRSCLGMQTVAV